MTRENFKTGVANMLFAFYFIQAALACLSKFQSPERQQLEDLAYRTLIPKSGRRAIVKFNYEVRRQNRNALETRASLATFYEQMRTVETGIAECFGSGKVIDGGLSISKTDTFEDKRRLVTYWLAMKQCGYFEPILQYMQVCESKRIEALGLDKADLVLNQLYLFFNAKLYKTTENDLVNFITEVKKYILLHSLVIQEQLEAQAKYPQLVERWRQTEMPLVNEFCETMITALYTFVYVFDPDQKIFDGLDVEIDLSMIQFESIYLNICTAPKFNAGALLSAFANIKTQMEEWKRNNEQIKEDFIKLLDSIKAKMDSQFEDQSPEDLKDQAVKIPEVAQDVLVVADEKEEEPQITVQAKPTREEMLEVHRKNKERRIEAQSLRQKLKHDAHLEKIERITESDDSDVHFYYNAKNPLANSVFNKNQSAQACKLAFSKTDRFQHSFYPEITASGETINFLCSLLVSGTPTYEGFLAAHKDLGGVFVQKKNGNKLFFFKEPISYHKTLHAPHLSSSFDHVLYRRFYRNCALHPYFFKLLK